jgi:serine/threonine-protein kinase
VTRIVERAMSKRAEDRFASMDELIEQLDAAMHERDEASEVDLRRYSSEQMRLVIDRALRQPSTDGARFSHDELVAAAREIGVDDEALDQALSELEDEADDAAESEPSEATAALLPGQPGWWNEERRREAYKLIRHLLVFAVVNTAMWLVFHAGWIRWMLFGWGMGLALHAVNVVMPKRDEDKKKKRRQREGEQKEKRARRAERRRERQQRRHPERGDKRRIEAEPADLERAAELLRDTSERRRQRLAPVDEPAREREAELEAELEAKRRRRTPSTR